MQPLVVLTATYNHPNELKKLYESLRKQSDHEFSWVIVDDGSGEETRRALEDVIKEDELDITVIHQENGGKSRAINRGLDAMEGTAEFVIIVDDDEQLVPEAISIIKEYVGKYKNSDCGVIHFNRRNEKGEVIATPPITEDFFMSYQQFKAERRFADGYVGYFCDKLGDQRFRVCDGEKYVAPSVLFMQVTLCCQLLWAKAVLGDTEYLDGGITKQGRRLRLKNPLGMMEYCDMMLAKRVGVKSKLLYSIQWYAYQSLCIQKDSGEGFRNGRVKLMKPFGRLLAFCWKVKYK